MKLAKVLRQLYLALCPDVWSAPHILGSCPCHCWSHCARCVLDTETPAPHGASNSTLQLYNTNQARSSMACLLALDGAPTTLLLFIAERLELYEQMNILKVDQFCRMTYSWHWEGLTPSPSLWEHVVWQEWWQCYNCPVSPHCTAPGPGLHTQLLGDLATLLPGTDRPTLTWHSVSTVFTDIHLLSLALWLQYDILHANACRWLAGLAD